MVAPQLHPNRSHWPCPNMGPAAATPWSPQLHRRRLKCTTRPSVNDRLRTTDSYGARCYCPHEAEISTRFTLVERIMPGGAIGARRIALAVVGTAVSVVG